MPTGGWRLENFLSVGQIARSSAGEVGIDSDGREWCITPSMPTKPDVADETGGDGAGSPGTMVFRRCPAARRPIQYTSRPKRRSETHHQGFANRSPREGKRSREGHGQPAVPFALQNTRLESTARMIRSTSSSTGAGQLTWLQNRHLRKQGCDA